MADSRTNDHLIFEPDEVPPVLLSIGHGLLQIVGRLTSMAAGAAIVVQASDLPTEYRAWLFSMSLAVCGIGTIVMIYRFGRFGSGYMVGIVSGSAFIAVTIAALSAGGPALMSSAIAASAIVLFLFVHRLSLLRRIITPAVAGTVQMLVAGSVMSILMSRVSEAPAGESQTAVLAVASTTLGVMLALTLFAPPAIRTWTPILGIVAGCVASVPVGLYDGSEVLDAAWIGIPISGWPGLGFSFGVDFWALLPGFVLVYLATTIRTISDLVNLQRVSWHQPRATDFRVVQGALNVAVATNLLAAVTAAMPNMTPSSSSSRVILSGVAARRVGLYAGGILIGVAFLPKAVAFLTSIPAAVFGAYVIVMLALQFVQGMRLVVEDGIDRRVTMIVGVSFWLGMGFQNDLIFPGLISGPWESLLGNGVTTGCIALLALTLLANLTSPRARRMRADLDIASLPAIDAFLRDAAGRARWDDASTERLRSAGEETLASLLPLDADAPPDSHRGLIVSARRAEGGIALEFVATSEAEGENLEDRLAYLGDEPTLEDDRELSFRLLRHYASSVQHRKYHEIDIVTVEVDGSRAA